MRWQPILLALLSIPLSLPTLGDEKEESLKKARLKEATEHMQLLELFTVSGESVPLCERPLLTFGDSARSNENGTLWAWGDAGRPLACVELYLPASGDSWVHALTLTSTEKVSLKGAAGKWEPDSLQMRPQVIPDAPAPAMKAAARMRQIKDMARRFTAHEFWDPDNSRFELRLLVQPVLRYSDTNESIQDGALFVLAHGTNPEVLLLVEAIGKSVEESRWHCGFARLGSAELHVELDGKEVWKAGRAERVVGDRTDPYWLFSSLRTDQ